MTSFLGLLVRGAIRLYTFKYRRKQASLSYNIKTKSREYKCPERFFHDVKEYNGVKVETLTPKGCVGDKMILHFHGGGAVRDLSDGFYRKIAEKYAKETGLRVCTVDFTAGRDKVHPSLLDECYEAYRGVTESGVKPENIIAVGDSMGANLMLATCLKARDNGLQLPRALVSVCGFLDFTSGGDSYFFNAHKDPMYALPFYMSAEKHSHKLRRVPPYAGNSDLKDPYLSPAYGNYSGFPPLLIICGETEVDESDSAMLYEATGRAGAESEYKKYKGMFHDFLYVAPFIKESRAAWKEVAEFVKSRFS